MIKGSIMLYVLGLKHYFQNTFHKDFNKYVRNIIKKYNISYLAEEYSTEAAIRFTEDGESQLLKLSYDLKLKHLYCDPTNEEREKLGIPTEDQTIAKLGLKGKKGITTGEDSLISEEQHKYWYIREEEWLTRMRDADFLEGNTLFLVGYDHRLNFSKLLRKNDIKYKLFKTRRFK